MGNTFREGTVNIAAINTPGVFVDIILPTPFVTAAPTNVQGYVGVGSWGTPNTFQTASSTDEVYTKVGRPQVRAGDLATHLAAGFSQGTGMSARFVRVTDGTDTAATLAMAGGQGRFTAKSTGTLGNSIGVSFAASVAPGSFAANVQFPNRLAERFDNITKGLASVAVTPGSGYTSVPSYTLSPPQQAGGSPASAQPRLAVVGTPAISAGGTGHAVNDVVMLGAGVQIKVLTVTGGAIATFSVVNTGQISSGTVPANVGQQTSSTGAGTGAAFTLSWGLAQPAITPGSGYSTITGTLTGGGGTGGAYAPALSFWAALATAINQGNNQRGASGYIVYTPGTSTADPTLGVLYQLAGGTDGAAGVKTSDLIGVDGSGLFRTGMYALRSTGMDCFELCDCTDPASWAPMLALALDETADAVAAMPAGTLNSDAIAARFTYGVDDPNFWLLTGDWPTFNDGLNGSRLVSPAAFALGSAGNLSPELSPINKPLIGVQSTITSQSGILTSNADNGIAQEGGIDFIGRTASLGASYFSFVTGRSTSSNTAARGIEYSRLTNFIARSLQGPATRQIVGRLQSATRADDPTRAMAKAILDSFFAVLVDPAYGSQAGYGMIDAFATQCDTRNNSRDSIIRGFLIAYAAVQYLNTVRVFVIKLNGGGNVDVSGSISTSTNVAAALAAIGNAA